MWTRVLLSLSEEKLPLTEQLCGCCSSLLEFELEHGYTVVSAQYKALLC